MQYKGRYLGVTNRRKFKVALKPHVASVESFGGSVNGDFDGDDYVVVLDIEPGQMSAYQAVYGVGAENTQVAELLKYCERFVRG